MSLSSPSSFTWTHLFSFYHSEVSEVAQSCLTLCNPMSCSLPGFSVHGIFQARILEWVAISFYRLHTHTHAHTHTHIHLHIYPYTYVYIYNIPLVLLYLTVFSHYCLYYFLKADLIASLLLVLGVMSIEY